MTDASWFEGACYAFAAVAASGFRVETTGCSEPPDMLPRLSAAPRANAPRVSVAMCVYAPEPRFFRAAVRSVLAQTFEDFELLVYETPSDGAATTAILAECADPRIRHEVAPGRIPLSTARNRTLELACGALVAILDADDECDPHRFERQVAYLDAHPDVTVVGSWLEVVRADGTRCGYRPYPTGHDAIVRAMRRLNPVGQPSVMLRRDAALAVGGYVVHEDGPCEDYDLWVRLAQNGARFANLPEPLTRYRLHSGSLKHRQLRNQLRHTIAIKKEHFGDQLGLGDRLRMCAERGLILLPTGVVAALFRRMALVKELPKGRGGGQSA